MAGTNKKLVIPNKASKNMPQPEYGTDMRAIEQYATPGQAYASLTGPGETTAPGMLVQDGGFYVIDETGEGIILFSTDAVSIEIGPDIQSISVSAAGVVLSGNVAPGISFDGGTDVAVMPITVTGSRGGNAALASLITALASCGLITDGTTP